MRLLIITQKADINDDILGFFHSWLFEFSKKCESVITLCLEKGRYDLPANVKVLSLGKEKFKIQKGTSSSQTTAKFKIHKKFIYLINFYKHIWQERKNYDAVFVHMNPVYAILGGFFWRLSGKKIILWYTHRQVDAKLRLAEKFVNFILTASKGSFQLPTKKVKVLGHGIDIEKFIPLEKESPGGLFKIIYVGRIAKIKNQETLIKAVDYLINNKNIKDIQIDFIGSPIYEEDRKLLAVFKKMVEERKIGDYINFAGSVPNKDIAKIYQQADLTVNLCPTGGLDKAVLESMAAGVPVIVFNKSFKETIGEYQSELILNDLSEKELAQKITDIKGWDFLRWKKVSLNLRAVIIREHSLDKLLSKIINCFKS